MVKQKEEVTFKEFQKRYFPNSILDRLEKMICSELGLIEPYQHKLSKEKGNPKIGRLEFTKPNFCFKTASDILNLAEKFYREEGYKVERKNDRIEVKKGRENYWITLSDYNESYGLWVNKKPLSLYWLGRQMARESLSARD